MNGFAGITIEELAAAILACPPANLLAITLLRERAAAPGGIFPTDITRDEVVNATMQMAKYMRDCAELAKQVKGVRGVAADTQVAETFAL